MTEQSEEPISIQIGGELDGGRYVAWASISNPAVPDLVDPYCPDHGSLPTAYSQCSCSPRIKPTLAQVRLEFEDAVAGVPVAALLQAFFNHVDSIIEELDAAGDQE